MPFLLSFVLTLIGHYIRTRAEESPVFHELASTEQTETAPLSTLFRHHPKKVVRTTVIFRGNNAAGYMLTGGFILGYATNRLGLDAGTLLNIITVGSVAWLISTWISGVPSDRIGRRRMYITGWLCMLAWLYPLLLLVDTGDMTFVVIALVVFGAVMGLSYGPLPALYAELSPPASGSAEPPSATRWAPCSAGRSPRRSPPPSWARSTPRSPCRPTCSSGSWPR